MNIGNGVTRVNFDLCSNLRQRLRQLNLDRERSQVCEDISLNSFKFVDGFYHLSSIRHEQIKVNECTEQLQNLVSKVPKKSRETNDQLDAKIQ